MGALKTRTRSVVFRLTQDEYERLKAECHEKGKSNFSEFARSELFALATHSIAENMFQMQLNEISGQLVRLELLLQEVHRELNQTAAACQGACVPATQEGI